MKCEYDESRIVIHVGKTTAVPVAHVDCIWGFHHCLVCLSLHLYTMSVTAPFWNHSLLIVKSESQDHHRKCQSLSGFVCFLMKCKVQFQVTVTVV